MATPQASTLNTTGGTFAAVKSALSTQYSDAGAWATWAAGVVESKLGNITANADDFDIAAFINAAEAAINGIPDPDELSVIEFTRPTEPTYDSIPPYAAPTAPTYDTISYTPPNRPTYITSTYYTPTMKGTVQTIPAPTYDTVGAPPNTLITFDNPDFADSLLTSLRSKLEGDLAIASTGLGDAEAALFARETARQNTARALAYNEITDQFSSRGFDMPPGAILAKQTELNNESNIRLSDSSSQIMAESAKLAQAWNQTTVTTSYQTVDVLARVFDSKIMRNFEAAKNTVMLAVEAFKASIQEFVANADLQGRYITTIGPANESIAKIFVAEVGAESARINAEADINKSYAQVYSAEAGAESSKVSAVAQSNQSKATSFKAEVDGKMAEITAPAESNKAKASEYGARASAEGSFVSAQGQRNQAEAAGYEVISRKALGIAELAKSFALANIDTATRKYLGEIQVMQAAAQSAASMCASALNTVTVSASLGASGSWSESTTEDLNTTRTDNIRQSEEL